jgi:hypothetical protein
VTTYLWGLLTVISLAVAIVVAMLASLHVRRLERQPTLPASIEIGSAQAVLRKLRKGQALTPDELEYAKRIVGNRTNVMTFCIPLALFALGCFYVFGSLYHLHGATPSERTFLGVFPMLASLNFTTQILRSMPLKRRLRKIA